MGPGFVAFTIKSYIILVVNTLRLGQNHGCHLSLGLQGLYSATNCADNILGRFTIILQNQIARVDSFTNLTKRWVFRFRLNASISSHNLISFGKQFHARSPYTVNARLPKVSCLNFETFRTRSSLDHWSHFPDDNLKWIFLNENVCISIKNFIKVCS